MMTEKLIVSKYYKQFLNDVATGLDQLHNDLQFVSTIQKYFVKYLIIEGQYSMNFAVENAIGMTLDTQKYFSDKNEYAVNFYNNGAISYISAKFHKVYELTDDEVKPLQSKRIYVNGTNDSGFIRNNKIMFNKWRFTTEELLKIKDKTIAVIYDLFKDNDFKPQFISHEKPLQFKVFLISKYLTKTFKYHLLYSTILNDLKRQADCYIARDRDCCDILKGAMISSFVNCTAGIIGETTNKYNMPNHFKVSFTTNNAKADEMQTRKDESGLVNYKIILHCNGSTVSCNKNFLDKAIDNMLGPFGRYEELNQQLTRELNYYLGTKYNGKYKIRFSKADGVFPIYRDHFNDDEQARMIKQFKHSFLINCHEVERNRDLKFTLYETNSQVDNSIIYHLKAEHDVIVTTKD